MSDNIKVVVKVRPLISREIEDKLSYQWQVKNNTLYQLDHHGRGLGQSFTFDKVYDENTKTSDVYEDIAKPIVEAATTGINGTIFAYGQTSSGKTYTMTGTESSPGIIPLAVLNLFEIIKNVPNRDFLVRVSYIEIYNEKVMDLLNMDTKEIKIKETLQGVKVDSKEFVTSSPAEVLEAMKEGEANRQKGSTNMNEESSRSHSIFQITIESREHIEGEEASGSVNVSQLNLVDLAGSERAGQTGATGKRFIEGTHINKSLSNLALVIKQLSEFPNKFANYRDSKLTRILQNSLGGNAKTSIICAVTPASIEETISTLQFANRAKAIQNKPEVNEVATDKTMIQSLTKQMSKLKAQLESKKSLEQDNYNLQNKIANLQKLILNGFAQRRSVDLISGPRRKLQQPRRITISTLHTIEDEPSVPIPKFCTPSLKYNPLCMSSPVMPTPLPPVAEEPARMSTPPRGRGVKFSGDVIELDSDDDSTHDDVQTCSPTHKCYGSSKTPPCVLRRNAKEAEKNLKDIVEWTEREKIYSPSAVEYIEKLEQNTTVIAKLQDEIEKLNQLSKEKDLEVENLKSKIKKSEEDLKVTTAVKMDLQTLCDNYTRKLTDWEVTYETLRDKARLREEELLSLLDEITVTKKKPEDIEKILSRTLDKEMHFMDMSKDISLVNSDNEASILHNDDESDQVSALIADSHAQVMSNNQTIIDLEANLFAHKQKILALENLSQDLQGKVNSLTENVNKMENENSSLQSTIDSLNITIQNQKESLETANNDIESYNNLIQELHVKVTQKEPDISINDSVLENMIANEDKFLANNENMKNIIQSLKIALNTRNNEIDNLKTQVSNQNDAAPNNTILTEQIEAKTLEINTLKSNVDNLQKQINENIATINKVMHEKNDLKDIERQLSEKLAVFEEKVNEIEKINKEDAILIQSLKDDNNNLTMAIAEKNVTAQEASDTNKQLLKQIDDLTNKISELEKEIQDKDDLICSLKKDDTEAKDCLLKAKAAVIKSQLILGTLSGNMQEVPEIIDNFVTIFSVLSDSMNTLENVANDIVTQKKEALKDNAELKTVLEELTVTHDSEISALQEQITILSQAETNEKDTLTQINNQLTCDLDKTRNELDTKISEYKTLEASLNQVTQNIETSNEEISTLKTEKANLDQSIVDKESIISNLTKRLQDIENTLENKTLEVNTFEERLNHSYEERNQLLNKVFQKIADVADSFNIQCEIRKENENVCVNVYEQILLTLDKIRNHVTFISMKKVDDDTENVSELLLDAKKEIVELSQQNLNLIEQLSDIENKNRDLSNEAKLINIENQKLNEEIVETQDILECLQAELKLKADDLSNMEHRVREWKEQFTNLDFVMKQQMYELKLENENLKTGVSVHKKELEQSVFTYEHVDPQDTNQAVTTKQQLFDLSICTEKSSPQSLLTICCNKIIDYIQPKEIDSKTTTISSNAPISVQSDETYIIKCKCSQLSLELEAAKEENAKILDLLEQMEVLNQHLIQEQEAVRNEIKLLVGPATELQKKIVNHKTNLSILTATTIAENRSLKSQVKVLQHHHSRFHNVCQRDIPDFKKQLSELMILLKGDPHFADQLNAGFKRYSLPDVLDSSTALPNFKNESTLDGDLLMLDTNLTMTTAADNTLLGHDQTCLNLTQFYDEACYQTTALNQITNQNIQQMDILTHDNQTMYDKLRMLNDENYKLRELVDKYTDIKQIMTDAQSSPIKSMNDNDMKKIVKDDNILLECVNCQKLSELQETQVKLNDELKSLSQELLDIKVQKAEIEEKYSNLVLETPQIDVLVKKLSTSEKDINSKMQEITKLNDTLSIKSQEIKSLQDENDTLSNQIMESISEVDDLNKELGDLKKSHNQLMERYNKLEGTAKDVSHKDVMVAFSCPECTSKDELIMMMQSKITKNKLNRSLSDSDTSSRCNKIFTLQSELHAGREDCKELTEDVVTIKNHLDRSNLSMDFDVSMEDASVYGAIASPQSKKCIMPDIPEERPTDLYTVDKTQCFNYFIEKTGKNDNLNSNIKIVELMKMFYDNMVMQHGNEVENLTNKLKHYEESKNLLENQLKNLVDKHSHVTKQLEQRDHNHKAIANLILQLKNNINLLNQEILVTDVDNDKLINLYKEKCLTLLDNELGLGSEKPFESLMNKIVKKQEIDLTREVEKYTKLQEHVATVTTELNTASENLTQMKSLLNEKENECNILKEKKERIHEISSAVTLDLINKEKEMTQTITDGYKKLIDLNILNNQNLDLNLPLNMNVNFLFEHLINQNKNRMNPDIEKEKDSLTLQVNDLKHSMDEKRNEIEVLQTRNKELQENNNVITIKLVEKDTKLQELKTLQDDLNKLYESKVNESIANIGLIRKLSEEVNLLKADIQAKENTIKTLELHINEQTQYSEKDAQISQLIETVKGLQDDISHFKAMNEVILKEKDTYAAELLKSSETIRQNNHEMDKMTSDILVLKESIKDNVAVIENLNVEAKKMLKQNMELKEQLEERHKERLRLETNIKTHEDTAQIQTRMIMRLEKQKNEDDRIMSEKNKQIEELTHKCVALQKRCDGVQTDSKDKNEVELLRLAKETLEARVSELESLLQGHKTRPSLDAIADSSRRRRQSLLDSNRMFADNKHDIEDQHNVESLFDSRPKPDDLFMDVDEDVSNRSTPIRLSKGRDSLSLSRTDQSEKEDDHPSRPSSVVATRRRRQSTHDLHRSVIRHTPSPHGHELSKMIDESNHSKPSDTSGGNDSSEMSQLKERLASCQQELEELKEKYRELDEECETCAEYLRERDEQCVRLKKERTALQGTITELKGKLQSNVNVSQHNTSKPSVADAAVNTDEDWTNLHSVVVDRMSFDAEVEKNKKLAKTIEELRFKKQDLKNTLAKMQKALERNSGSRELESTKQELQACKQELVQLRERYKELDEECETCAQYLRDKEQQCRRLKEAKTALEAKLQELQGDSEQISVMTHSTRKKRQSLHDQNRGSTGDVKDASTETSDDFLSYQVERDGSYRPLTEDMQAKEMKRLKSVVEVLSHQKAMLEQQLVSVSAAMHAPHPAMYVATGSAIVQNQQLTDVMKENQKLKKITAKLVNICKKRGKDSNRENEDPANEG